MIRAWLGLISFVPRKRERTEQVFQRFVDMLYEANGAAGPGIESIVRSRAGFSLLGLTQPKRAKLLNENGHRLPRNEHGCRRSRERVTREMVLENHAFESMTCAGIRHQQHSLFTGGSAQLLYECKCKPTREDGPRAFSAFSAYQAVGIYDVVLYEFEGAMLDDNCSGIGSVSICSDHWAEPHF